MNHLPTTSQRFSTTWKKEFTDLFPANFVKPRSLPHLFTRWVTIATLNSASVLTWNGQISCLLAEHLPGCCGVQQQPVGSLRGWHGPGGRALFAARAQHRRLAHIQPGRGLQPGSATLQHHWRPGATRVLHRILCRLVGRPADLCLLQRSVAQLLILGPPPGLRCRTLASTTRGHWKTSRWFHISWIPVKRRWRSLSQLSCQTLRCCFLLLASSGLHPARLFSTQVHLIAPNVKCDKGIRTYAWLYATNRRIMSWSTFSCIFIHIIIIFDRCIIYSCCCYQSCKCLCEEMAGFCFFFFKHCKMRCLLSSVFMVLIWLYSFMWYFFKWRYSHVSAVLSVS